MLTAPPSQQGPSQNPDGVTAPTGGCLGLSSTPQDGIWGQTLVPRLQGEGFLVGTIFSPKAPCVVQGERFILQKKKKKRKKDQDLIEEG